MNRDFTICPTYPPAVIVPAAVDDDALRKAARFRQGGRFPVLSYYHPKNGTVMLRSSQPLTGPNRKRCHEDELLLGMVLDEGEQGFIIDTRSAQAVKQARMTGGGTEPKSSYPQWKRLHRPLERGRPLQESFIKLVEACNDTLTNMDRWLSRLESCRWLSHVKAALSTAYLAAQCMDREEASVLVHGVEGTDTTLLVTALAQVILDSSCRTLTGFQGLLEREWIQVRAAVPRGLRTPAPPNCLSPIAPCRCPTGRASLPPPLCPLCLLPCSAEAGGTAFPPLSRLRVAAEPPVPLLPGVQ